MMKQLQRSEVPVEETWALEDIYPSQEVWDKDYQKVIDTLPTMREKEGQVIASAQSLYQTLSLQDEISTTLIALYTYAHMRRHEDNRNPTYKALSSKASELLVRVNEATAFVDPEIMGLDPSKLEGFFQEFPKLTLYKHHLDSLLRLAPHTLSSEQEKLLAAAGEIAQAPGNIFSMFNNADIRFPRVKNEEGEEVELTHGRFRHFMESRDRRVRRDAYLAMYTPFQNQKNTLSATFEANLRQSRFFSQARKYDSTLAASLFPLNIPQEVYTNLIDAVHQRIDLMHRYVSLRKRALGLDELHYYDVYTPIVPEVKVEVAYDDAVEMILQGLKPLGEEYIKVLKDGFANRWIDRRETEGKTSGAFQWGPYGVHPYVLLNYQGTLDDVFTIAHEMGHALHHHFSDENQPYVYHRYTIFLAEVASTVNEALLAETLKERFTDPKKKLYLLNHLLDQFRGTVYRQTLFAEFEKKAHEALAAGQGITPEFLSETYRELNQTYYGPELIVDEQIEMEWARIPHFYTPFYVYQYSTGFSAAMAISQRILSGEAKAKEDYLRFLSAGSSDYSIEILARAGVDMRTPAPVLSALDVFEKALDEMESLLGV